MIIKKWNGSGWDDQYPDVNVDSFVFSGTPSSTTFARGDGVWAAPALNDLSNVSVVSPITRSFVQWNASSWVDAVGVDRSTYTNNLMSTTLSTSIWIGTIANYAGVTKSNDVLYFCTD